MNANTQHFTDEQVSAIIKGGLPFPITFFVNGNPRLVIEAWVLTSMSGMSTNGGTPTELVITKHRAGKDPETLIYKLDRPHKSLS